MWGTSFARATVMAFMARSPTTTVTSRSFTSTTTSLAATQYLLKYDYIPDVLEKRGPYREKHLGLAQKLIDEGRCLSGGPTGPVEMEVPTGALFIFTDVEAAQQFVKEDPYVSGGIVTGHDIQEYNVVLQK
eukprot:CAMPEP_0178925920 /NCGR_PEP_ID=MMETSP0786-20121207/18206_1 /TAXON_ID=186022 /ORGANISM="Thalassionema frauenfeldii, Strain CCMP 1798" /LENGTH=130 /DNA_ID=CAMNT_0020600907 /DNA_START=69 /DNA_END=461 /DNA_ORIENTATION=+